MRIKMFGAVIMASALVLTSCGGSDEGDESSPPATTTTTGESAATTTGGEGGATTTGGSEPVDSAPTCSGLAEPDPAAPNVSIDLIEWEIATDADISSGGANLTINNTANGTHELLVIKGDSFESLPKLSNGAVDEDALDAGAIVATAERLSGNTSCATSVDLAPGNYVLLCNINSGPNSHAAKGQRLDITVS